MKETLPAYLPKLFAYEGGYVDHKRDPGGATNFGITLKTLSSWRGRNVSKAEVRTLSQDEASRIYKARYWDRTGPRGADYIPAGPDAALFDVAVNSGPGRANAWYPLIEGKSPVDAVKAVCARRRAFFHSLSTFDVFGRGWMRRVNEVEAWCIAWAVKAQGGAPAAVLKGEAASSKVRASKAKGGATVTGGAGSAVVAQQASSGIDWLAVGIIGIPFLVAAGFLVYQAVSQSARAEAMAAEAEAV